MRRKKMRFTFGKSKSSFGQRRVPAQHWRGAEIIRWMGRRRRLALGLAYQSEVLVNVIVSFSRKCFNSFWCVICVQLYFYSFRAGANFRPSVPIFGVYAIILGILTYFFFSKAKIPLMQLSMVLSCLCAA